MVRVPAGPTRSRRKRPEDRFSRPGQRAFDRVIIQRCRAPAKNKPVQNPQDEIHENPGKHDVGEKMSAGSHPQNADRCAKDQRGAIGWYLPLGRDHGGGRHGPECTRRFSRDERAIVRTGAARIPPWREMKGAAEVQDVDRARSVPMIFQDCVGDNPRTDRKREQHEQRGTAANKHASARQQELSNDGDTRYGRDSRDNQTGSVARMLLPKLTSDREIPRLPIEKWPG